MSCRCQCCQAGTRCAHVLVLAPKDHADADRLWRRYAESNTVPGYVDLSKRTANEQRAIREPAEPTELVTCRECGGSYAMAVFLVAALHSQRAPAPPCEPCMLGNRQQAAFA